MDVIAGELVRLRPAVSADASRFEEILSHAEVARWWGDACEDVSEQVREVLDPADNTSSFAIEVEGTTVGVIQCWEEPTPQYRHAGIDIALHPEWHRRGIGTDAVRTLARHLLRDRGHHRLVIDPAASNEVAIRVYRRVEFRPVGIMRHYERGPDGSWHDGLLMELLAGELSESPAAP